MRQTGTLTSWRGRAEELEGELRAIDDLLAEVFDRAEGNREALNKAVGRLEQPGKGEATKTARTRSLATLKDCQWREKQYTALLFGTRERIRLILEKS